MTIEREPMPTKRFKAVCMLTGATIGGAVLLGVVRAVGFGGFVWAVGAFVATGIYNLAKNGF